MQSTQSTEQRGGHALIEREVLATQLHAERAGNLLLADPPECAAGRSVPAVADQDIRNAVLLPTLLAQPAVLQRHVIEDRECGGRRQISLGEAALLVRRGVAKVFLEMRHGRDSRDVIESRGGSTCDGPCKRTRENDWNRHPDPPALIPTTFRIRSTADSELSDSCA